MLYTAATASLAALELLVHLDKGGITAAYVTVEFQFDAALVEAVPTGQLPKRWRARTIPAECQVFGDRWIREGRSAVLRVPSVIIRSEFNFLINPAHPDFARIKVGKPRSFRFDRRLK
jgi:RES domain-containing protein